MWYRVVGFGRSGPVRRTPEQAWEGFFRGVATHERGTLTAATSARLVAATTRRAAESADVSVVRGRAGRGEW